MIKIPPTSRPPGAAVEFIEQHLIPMMLAFTLGMLVMDGRAEYAQADRAQAWHDQLQSAHRATAEAGAALNRVLVLVAQADADCGAPAGTALPDVRKALPDARTVRPAAGALHRRVTSAPGEVAQ